MTDVGSSSVQVGNMLRQAGGHLAAGRFGEGEALCRKVLAQDARSADALYMLGVACAGQSRLEAALEAFDAALIARPGFTQVMAQRARVLLEMNRRGEAVRAVETASALDPKDAHTLDTLGNVLTRAGLHKQAVDFYARAAKMGTSARHAYNLAAAQQFLGNFDEARAAYRDCLARDPRHASAWSGLVQITKQTASGNEIGKLEKIFEAMKANPYAALDIGHALAKAHEDLGDPAMAMVWLDKAKAGMRARLPSGVQDDAKLFAAAGRAMDGSVPGKTDDGGPIFVVGMPRSGTTLVERILTSHSQIGSAGELLDFPLALREASGIATKALFDPAMMTAVSDMDVARAGDAYLRSVEETLGLTGRFVDKLPFNFLLVPHILRTLPNARVICLRRHPADTVLGNYRQVFAPGTGHLDFTFDLQRAAHYVVSFRRLVEQYATMLPPGRFCEVAYEDVVIDLEGETRRLLHFCGVPFETACLNFHENATPVATASAAQVRQPIYASSVGRWKACRPAVDPALQVLVDAGLMNADEAFG